MTQELNKTLKTYEVSANGVTLAYVSKAQSAKVSKILEHFKVDVKVEEKEQKFVLAPAEESAE